MKRFLLFIFSVMSISAFAQKDISITVMSPVNGTTITSGQAFNFSVRIKNEGSADITSADSISIFMTINSDPVMNNGQILGLLYVPSTTIAPAQSVNVSVQGGTLTINSDTSAANADFCVIGLLTDNDDNMANNVSCATVNVVGTTTGVSATLAENIKVYPNPAADYITVSNANYTFGDKILVYDLSGKELVNTFINGTEERVDVSTLTKGLYIYQIRNEQGTVITSGKLSIVK